MARIEINGGVPLQGEVWISGAKNAVLPILVASLLGDEPSVVGNVPHLQDVTTTMELLGRMGAELSIDERMQIQIDPRGLEHFEAPYDLVKTMRASILVLGPLVARHGRAVVSLPGGCAIGARPINLHVAGLEKLGATLKQHRGDLEALSGQPFSIVRRVDDRYPDLGRQQRRLPRVLENRDHEPVEHGARAADDVDVAVGDGVEGAGIDREVHRSSWRR